MINITQYGDFFAIYILMLLAIPAVLLGLRGKNLKYYGILMSCIMTPLIIFRNYKETVAFFAYIVFEYALIYIYRLIRMKTDDRKIYLIFLILSIFPLVFSKFRPYMGYSAIGFIGISYISFRCIAMIMEIFDGSIKKFKFSDLFYFLIFSPTFISGPIDRFKRFEENIKNKVTGQEYKEKYLKKGIERFIIGMGYKFILAYLISSMFLERIPKTITLINSVKYMYTYSLYLFFDFAGYSLMAQGSANLLGIDVIYNFNKPFISKDLKEFWTRWHISLSRWFGDYVFSRILINIRRKKLVKNRFTAAYISQITTMFMMGVWHGLTPFYLIYGAYHGILLVLNDLFIRKSRIYKKYKDNKAFNFLQIVITIHIVCFGLLIFSGYLFPYKKQ